MLKKLIIAFGIAAVILFVVFENQPPVSTVQVPITSSLMPDLTGLPSQKQIISLTQNVIDVMSEDTDPQCNAIDLRLRMMIFQHFVIYQHMLNAQNIYLNSQVAHLWAHVLAMILKESGGDAFEISDMTGNTILANQADANLQQWQNIIQLIQNSSLEFNYQTNFGLSQTSFDRLFVAFRLAQSQQYDTSYLEGINGLLTPKKSTLNTAVAIRRLIWFYQDFAQGRLTDSEGRMSEADINLPEFNARYKESLNMALLYCGTPWLFHEVIPNSINGMTSLQNAMASIAYCSLGDKRSDENGNKLDEICFAKWVTLCPALNVDIATLTPLSYFQTRNATPVCEKTFNALIKQKGQVLPYLPF